MLESAVENIVNGIAVNGFIAFAKKVFRGRYQEEVNLDVYLKKDEKEEHLLYVKVFYGRKPYYKPWVEFFDINSCVKLGNEEIQYFDSVFEDKLLLLFSQHISPGGKIYVEYYDDEETRRQLEVSFPAAITRLGHKLFKLGFSWFKDWYFSEGFMEGGIKLEGEKPVDYESEKRQCRDICEEVKAFLVKIGSSFGQGLYAVRTAQRAEEILTICTSIGSTIAPP